MRPFAVPDWSDYRVSEARAEARLARVGVVPPAPLDVAAPTFFLRELPPSVARTLHNIDVDAPIAADTVAFACFNGGDVSAMSFAAALPLGALEQALTWPGWRPKSRSALEAVVFVRTEGVDVSVFVLPIVAKFAEGRRLAVTGLLATKLHAILDRGTRRDFFDVYVLLRDRRLSITDGFAALRAVYGPDVNESLVLRALAFFDDAEREPPMPLEGPADWSVVKAYFREQVGRLLLPPPRTSS